MTMGPSGSADADPREDLPDMDGLDVQNVDAALGEPLSRTLDLDTWSLGSDLIETYNRMAQEVEAAVGQDRRIREEIRKVVFDKLRRGPNAFPGSGVYQATVNQIEETHKKLLFNGGVEACDGNSLVQDTLPLTIVQIGVCLVSYQGEQGAWGHRLYRRDLRVTGADPVQEMLGVLERRRERGAIGVEDQRDRLSDLARRGIMTFAERAVLLRKSTARWRMGHGNPAAYELLTGAGVVEQGRPGKPSTYPLMRASLGVLRELILEHKRFVFVPSTVADRMLLTIGHALKPLEFAIVRTLEDQLLNIVQNRGGHYITSEAKLVEEFAREAGPQIAVGVYRAALHAPPFVFYAHKDHMLEAALIAMADSVLQEHRGFPMLIDLADNVCTTVFGADSFFPAVRLAYTESGEPWRYEGERDTRR